MAPHTSGLAFLWSIEEENRGSTSQVGSNMGDCEENSAGDTPRLCQAHWIHQQSTWTHLPSSFPTWCGTWGHGDAAVGTQPWQCWGHKGWKGLSPPKSFCVIQVSHSVSSPPQFCIPSPNLGNLGFPKSKAFPPSSWAGALGLQDHPLVMTDLQGEPAVSPSENFPVVCRDV